MIKEQSQNVKDEFTRRLGKFVQVILRLTTRKNAKDYTLLNPEGSLAPDYFKKDLPKTIKDALGKTAEKLSEKMKLR